MALRRINPSKQPLLHLPRPFSSSSNPPFPPPPPTPPSDDPDASPRFSPPNQGEAAQKPVSSLFADIRERLRLSQQGQIPINPPRPTGQAPAPPVSFSEIKSSLAKFRASPGNFRASPQNASTPPPPFSGGGGGDAATPLFQDLLRNSGAPAARPQGGPNADGAKPFSFDLDGLRESIKKIDPKQHKQRQQSAPFLSSLPENIFGKDKEEEDAGVMLSKDYSKEDLGKLLAELRPPGAGKDGKEWFSLEELQGRIAKLAKMERANDQRMGGALGALRSSFLNIKKEDDEKKAVKSVGGIFTLSNLTGKPVPEYLSHPPQEELLERYFHPDHMSGEEKMKLELQKVRDEFKMSENDCGSARVQIAQLTLKIKHLSSVLHKKDKHSRKGLQDMVQRRKKYLKYLRGTDWDSYCLVLSKLGLRDIPEYKAPDYKKTQPTKAQSKKSKSKRKRKMKA